MLLIFYSIILLLINISHANKINKQFDYDRYENTGRRNQYVEKTSDLTKEDVDNLLSKLYYRMEDSLDEKLNKLEINLLEKLEIYIDRKLSSELYHKMDELKQDPPKKTDIYSMSQNLNELKILKTNTNVICNSFTKKSNTSRKLFEDINKKLIIIENNVADLKNATKYLAASENCMHNTLIQKPVHTLDSKQNIVQLTKTNNTKHTFDNSKTDTLNTTQYEAEVDIDIRLSEIPSQQEATPLVISNTTYQLEQSIEGNKSENKDHGTMNKNEKNLPSNSYIDNVQVKFAPRFTYPTRMPEREIMEAGNSIKLQCPAIGNPTPNITWYKNMVSPIVRRYYMPVYEKWSMTLNELRRADNGLYSCKVCNVLGCLEHTVELYI